MGVVLKAINHFDLFVYVTEARLIKNSNLKICYSIDDAINSLTPNGVLIYIALLDLYQVFTNLESYEKHLKVLSTDEQYSNVKVTQIILCNINHKFIVHCRNDDELINNIKNTMSSNTSTADCDDFVQLTFDVRVSSRLEERVLLQKIISYVSDPSIQLPPIMCSPIKKCEYIEHDLSNLYATPDNLSEMFEIMSERIKDIENYIATSRPITVNNIVVNGTVNKLINSQVTKPKSLDVDNMISNWINSNPPNVDEGHKVYYDRCKVALAFTKLSVSKFNKMVESCGYHCPSKQVRPYTWLKNN
jgi:hypothetical protein